MGRKLKKKHGGVSSIPGPIDFLLVYAWDGVYARWYIILIYSGSGGILPRENYKIFSSAKAILRDMSIDLC